MTDQRLHVRAEAIQIMRGVAALLVVLVHAINTSEWRIGKGLEPAGWLAGPVGMNEFGASGVDLFFVISGFVMGWMLVRRPELTVAAFARDRFLRVVPLFWIMSVGYAILLASLGLPITRDQIVTSITIFPVYDHRVFTGPLLIVGWSLACELGFYMVVAAAMILKPAYRIAVTAGMAATFATIGVVVQPDSDLLSVFANAMWFDFATGLMLFLLWSRRPTCCSRDVAAALVGTGLVMLMPWLIRVAPFLTIHRVVIDHGDGITRWLIWGLPWSLVLAGLVFGWPHWVSAAPASGLGRRAANLVGDASYSIYLVHMFVLREVERWWPSALVPADMLVGVCIAISTLAGIACFWWIERPLLESLRGRRLRERKRLAGADLATAL